MSVGESPLKELLFNLDTPELVPVSPEESFLKGWFIPPSSVMTSSLILTVDGRQEPVYTGLPRLDVKRHFGGKTGGRSGFLALLRTPEPGQRVDLCIRMDGVDQLLVNDIQVEQRRTTPDTSTGDGKVTSYQDWIFEREPKLFENSDGILKSLMESSYRPRISLLAEYRECHLYFLSRFLRSLSAQIYPDWQLCITGDFDEESESFHYARSFASTDSRVTLVPAVRSQDYNRAWKTALEAADGEWIAPVRIWDELHRSALLELAASLHVGPAEIIYSDEDEIDWFGQRSRPRFKPGFDLERLLSFNYVGHLTAIRRALVLKCGGFRSFPAGAREWDLLLRCCEQVGGEQIKHIAKPLYHVRTQEALRESGLDTDSPQPEELCQVVRDYATRTAKQADVQIGFPTDTIRLQYRIPEEADVSIFLRDEDGVFQTAVLAEVTDKCRVEFYGVLNHLVHRLPHPCEDGTRPALLSPLVSFEEIASDVLIFINRPIDSLSHHFLQELVAQALREDCGLVTGLAVDLERRFIHTGFIGEEGGRYIDPFAGTSSRTKALARHIRVVRSVKAVSDDFFAVRRSYVEAVGGFAKLHSSDMPQFVRILTEYAHRRGLSVLVTPYAIGVLDDLPQRPSRSEALQQSHRAVTYFNPNLSAFSRPYLLLET